MQFARPVGGALMDDRLAFIRRAPAIVEAIVRTAAREAIDARRTYDRVLDARDLANLALAELDCAVARLGVRLDGVGRYELAEATVRAATTLARSPLVRRLMRVPVARFRPTPEGADVALVDRAGNPHVVRIEAFSGDASRVTCAREIARTCARDTTSLRAPTIHLFSLRDGTLRSFAARPIAARAPQTVGRAA